MASTTLGSKGMDSCTRDFRKVGSIGGRGLHIGVKQLCLTRRKNSLGFRRERRKRDLIWDAHSGKGGFSFLGWDEFTFSMQHTMCVCKSNMRDTCSPPVISSISPGWMLGWNSAHRAWKRLMCFLPQLWHRRGGGVDSVHGIRLTETKS